jgi:hypothetical protein
MTGFSKMLSEATIGCLHLVTEAPIDRPFDKHHFGKFQPSPNAFAWAESKGLIRQTGPGVFRMTHHGQYFRNYVNGEQVEREKAAPEPVYA